MGLNGVSFFMAERKGFEPSVSYPTQTFQVCTFDHSDTSHYTISKKIDKNYSLSCLNMTKTKLFFVMIRLPLLDLCNDIGGQWVRMGT